MNENNILAAIGRIHRRGNKFIERELKKHNIHGIAPSHGDILFQLFARENITMNQLSCSIDKDKSTITALVDKLVRFDYVKREQDPLDGRIHRLSLTPKGRELQPIFEEISVTLLDAVYTEFVPEEKQQLLALLEKIKL
ncbi:MarR family transcriptional regulator [Paenibacillus helianthi]|uniref:MarR family transcriptional regulator n=1 Tax=Paenibacillus helianthi TaxID=1349432 RepID=A0ABX3EM93_9BACL|nr:MULTISPECIES: MarR family winged helix-turn-helix transcriptional regulator [Paenibacillus]OKP83607.1 MarR family transcriptional regulator [Paenibacillus sp. P3E]OKP83982.1 MarR family transcriptional regulator [Paenibacillus helianthi]OKP94711.1 MarR family transcriptional regulator [Paenibacillus sp. P32E]